MPQFTSTENRQRPALAHVVDAFGQVDLPDKAGEHGPVEEGLRESLRVPLRVSRVRVRGHRHGEVHGKEEADERDGAKEHRDKARRAAKALAEHRLENHPDKFNLAGVPHGNLGEVLGRRPFFQREVRGMRPRQELLGLRPAATTPRELVGRR